MVKSIVKDPFFLRQRSEEAKESDKQVIVDLMDTLKANNDRCVGMAANMIGVKKRIIVVSAGPFALQEKDMRTSLEAFSVFFSKFRKWE